MIDISELRRLESEATPGPWDADGSPSNVIIWSGPNERVCFMTSDGPAETNAALIVAMRNALPELLKALEWQPIETAPTGVSILIYYDDGCACVIDAKDNYYGWKAYDPSISNICTQPQFWRPLPLPPHGGGDVG